MISIHEKTSGLNDAPTDVQFYEYTDEVGTQGIYVAQTTNIHFDHGYIESVPSPLSAINSLGLTFDGNHIANSGTRIAVAQYLCCMTGSFRDNVIIVDGSHSVAALAVCSNNNNIIDFADNTSPVMTTSGCGTVQESVGSSTLTVTGSTVFVNGSSTAINTITAPGTSPGGMIVLYAGSSPGLTLASGGNINFGGLKAPLTVPVGSAIVLTLLDLGPAWVITSGPSVGGLAYSNGTAALYKSEVVTFSATPTFSATIGTSWMNLQGNVNSFTLRNAADGFLKTLCFRQSGAGYTVTFPPNIRGHGAVGRAAGRFNCQQFVFSSNYSLWFAIGSMQTNM